jgi:acyl dehydratase
LSVGQLTLGTTVANLGFSEVAFPKPGFHGDTTALPFSGVART